MSSQVTFGRGGATKPSRAELCAAVPASRAAKSTASPPARERGQGQAATCAEGGPVNLPKA